MLIRTSPYSSRKKPCIHSWAFTAIVVFIIGIILIIGIVVGIIFVVGIVVGIRIVIRIVVEFCYGFAIIAGIVRIFAKLMSIFFKTLYNLVDDFENKHFYIKKLATRLT